MDAMEISASALTAERVRINLIASNLANANATRTAEGGPYRRKDAVFAATLDEASAKMGGRGVKVVEVLEDQVQPRLQYDPSHPDADARGYVAYPNVNVVEEMADLATATRAYEANVTAAKASMDMQMKALQIGSK